MLEHINLGQINYLKSHKINLSHLKVLEMFYNKEDVTDIRLTNDLVRLGFVFRNEITELGKQLYEDFQEVKHEPTKKRQSKVKLKDAEFELWWKTFPPNPTYRNWISTRNLRLEKTVCQGLYRQIIEEGEYTEEMLLTALENEKTARKVESDLNNKNSFQFMKGTENYLRERAFEAYISVEEKPKSLNFNI